MAAGTLVPNRDQLVKICTDREGNVDFDLLNKFEQAFLGVDDIPALQDGVDSNTLSIATISDLVRPITIDLIQPLPSPVGADITYTLTPAQSTEGMKAVFIPASSLVASATGPWTLTITTGSGSVVYVPIVTRGDTINSGDLLFDIHVDSSGNIVSKEWSIEGSNSIGAYVYSAGGRLEQNAQVSKPLAGGSTLNAGLPAPYVGTYRVQITSRSFGGEFFSVYIFGFSTTAFQFAAGATTNDHQIQWFSDGRWRT